MTERPDQVRQSEPPPPSSTHPAGLAVAAVAEQGDPGPFIRRLREAIMLEGRRMDTAPALLDAAREIRPAHPLDLDRSGRVRPRRTGGGELWEAA